MNRDLMLAVLSMHAYSDDRSFNKIGNANVSNRSDESSGFYANSYTYNGETIISFRGTDGNYVGDAWYGWGAGVGAETTQAGLAAKFYQNVVGSAAFPFSTNVTFTGHSLGGGLAGLLAGLYGKTAVVFDNMAYNAAIANTYWDATHPTYPETIDGMTGLPLVNESHAGVARFDFGKAPCFPHHAHANPVMNAPHIFS
jgi:hypothetical protein